MTDNIKGFYAKLKQADIQQCKRIQVKELIFKQHFPLFSSHSSTDCKVVILLHILLIPRRNTIRNFNKKHSDS